MALFIGSKPTVELWMSLLPESWIQPKIPHIVYRPSIRSRDSFMRVIAFENLRAGFFVKRDRFGGHLLGGKMTFHPLSRARAHGLPVRRRIQDPRQSFCEGR